jgi:hypothetical protein
MSLARSRGGCARGEGRRRKQWAGHRAQAAGEERAGKGRKRDGGHEEIMGKARKARDGTQKRLHKYLRAA